MDLLNTCACIEQLNYQIHAANVRLGLKWLIVITILTYLLFHSKKLYCIGPIFGTRAWSKRKKWHFKRLKEIWYNIHQTFYDHLMIILQSSYDHFTIIIWSLYNYLTVIIWSLYNNLTIILWLSSIISHSSYGHLMVISHLT
jgi:hypothetical protein